MKWLALVGILMVMVTAQAQEETAPESKAAPKKAFFRDDTVIGFSYLQWNEKLRLQQGLLQSDDKANFEGATVNVERNLSFAKWGFVFGGMVGSGKASGGSGGSPINFQKGNQPWTLYGGYIKLYQKWSGRVYGGITVPVFFRQISWPDSNGISVTGGKNLNLGAMFELNLRLTTKWDLYQSIGPLNEEGSTMWRLGISYRL